MRHRCLGNWIPVARRVDSERIAMEDGRIVLWQGTDQLAQLELASLTRLVVVRFASGLVHGEEPFLVIEASGRLLVVPFLAEGSRELVAALLRRPDLSLWEAECDGLPLVWRRRLLGILPLFPLPKLALQERASMPPWPQRGPLPISELQRVAGEILDAER